MSVCSCVCVCCVFMCVSVCSYMCMCLYVYVHVYICVSVHMCVCIAPLHVCMCMNSKVTFPHGWVSHKHAKRACHSAVNEHLPFPVKSSEQSELSTVISSTRASKCTKGLGAAATIPGAALAAVTEVSFPQCVCTSHTFCELHLSRSLSPAHCHSWVPSKPPWENTVYKVTQGPAELWEKGHGHSLESQFPLSSRCGRWQLWPERPFAVL